MERIVSLIKGVAGRLIRYWGGVSVRAAAWVRCGKPLWIGTLFFAMCFLASGIVWLFGIAQTISDALRWSGLFLQIIGLGSVVIGLQESRRLFNQPSVFESIREWLLQGIRIFKPRHIVIKAEGGAIGISTAFGHARVTSSPQSDSVEDRLFSLERNIEYLRDEIDHLRKDGAEFRKKATEDLVTERKERIAGDEVHAKQLQEAVIGGIHIELAGLIYLLFGITFATIPDEIVAAF